jgi:signal transduction histidine kinase
MVERVVESPKVLVVDDNEQNRALVAATLEDEGYRVVLACSGQEGLAAFERESFDCALLDVKMPGMDGFALCRHIRAHERGRETPVMFLTALRDVDTFDEALGAGGDDFLVKPVRPTELLVRVQAALKLRRLTAENRGHYETIRQQRDALMRLQLQKEQLTAFLVHDLKGPVTALDLHAQLLSRDPGLSPRSQASTRAIREEARMLMRLIQNLLDISKSEAGELGARRAPVNLHELASNLQREFELQARAKELNLLASVEADVVLADPDLLRRVLENLLDNAVRHAPPGSRISLESRRVDDDVELRVVDQGHGVPEEARHQVFDKFVQLERAPSRGGYGLGLCFCKQAVELHGGRIWVEDAAPGAAFCVRLPRGMP